MTARNAPGAWPPSAAGAPRQLRRRAIDAWASSGFLLDPAILPDQHGAVAMPSAGEHHILVDVPDQDVSHATSPGDIAMILRGPPPATIQGSRPTGRRQHPPEVTIKEGPRAEV